MNIQNINTKIKSDIKNLYNKQPQTITYTTADMLKIVNFAFKTIINRSEYYNKNTGKLEYYNKNTGENIDIAKLKTMYDGFYAGYVSLMENPDFPIRKKIDLVSKKQMLDDYFRKNITYNTYNMTKLHKSVANKITTQNLKNKANKKLKIKANRISNFNSLFLKTRVAETNY